MREPLKTAITARDHAVVKLPNEDYAVAARNDESDIWETVTVPMQRQEAIEWLSFWRRKVLDLRESEQRPSGQWACPTCHGTDVQLTAWVHANTDEILSSGMDGPRDTYWCEDCQDEQTRLTWTVEEVK